MQWRTLFETKALTDFALLSEAMKARWSQPFPLDFWRGQKSSFLAPYTRPRPQKPHCISVNGLGNGAKICRSWPHQKSSYAGRVVAISLTFWSLISWSRESNGMA